MHKIILLSDTFHKPKQIQEYIDNIFRFAHVFSMKLNNFVILSLNYIEYAKTITHLSVSEQRKDITDTRFASPYQ